MDMDSFVNKIADQFHEVRILTFDPRLEFFQVLDKTQITGFEFIVQLIVYLLTFGEQVQLPQVSVEVISILCMKYPSLLKTKSEVKSIVFFR